jgi:putative oxidoreductase
MSVGALILRLVFGGLLIGHGTQKLFGWFGGHGFQATAGVMDKLGYPKGKLAAGLAGSTEAVAGLLLALGLLTPLAAAGVIGVMLNAAVSTHLRNGLWNTKGGIELALLYATAACALAFGGAGMFSLDRLLGLHLSGSAVGLGAVVLGVAAGFVVLALRRLEQAARQREVGGHDMQRAA